MLSRLALLSLLCYSLVMTNTASRLLLSLALLLALLGGLAWVAALQSSLLVVALLVVLGGALLVAGTALIARLVDPSP